jgi:CRISPR-associated endoribonuclease Cas6
MTDLGALVISLRSTRALTLQHHMGRAAHQLCLDLVRQIDPNLSAELHATYQTKPYTVSGLLLPDSTRPVHGAVQPGDGAWVRMVGLRADVVAALNTFAQQSPKTLNLDRTPWEVECITWTDHPWAGRSGYHKLVIDAQHAAPPDAIWLEFASPTAFSSADLNIPLPDPMRVFESLLNQWLSLSPFPLPESLLDFVRHFVPLTEYDAHTEKIILKTPEIGFCAKHVKFTIKRQVSVGASLRKNKPDYARELDVLNNRRDDLARVIALLADFAFFCGVGIKTTTGMGMVRRV